MILFMIIRRVTNNENHIYYREAHSQDDVAVIARPRKICGHSTYHVLVSSIGTLRDRLASIVAPLTNQYLCVHEALPLQRRTPETDLTGRPPPQIQAYTACTRLRWLANDRSLISLLTRPHRVLSRPKGHL